MRAHVHRRAQLGGSRVPAPRRRPSAHSDSPDPSAHVSGRRLESPALTAKAAFTEAPLALRDEPSPWEHALPILLPSTRWGA